MIAGLLYVSRVAQHALGLHAAQTCASRRGSEISDLAVDFRHFLNRPQHLLQTAFPAPIYLSGTSGSTLFPSTASTVCG
jgi:hypothetical protein